MERHDDHAPPRLAPSKPPAERKDLAKVLPLDPDLHDARVFKNLNHDLISGNFDMVSPEKGPKPIGSRGVVYRARDRQSGHLVAVKFTNGRRMANAKVPQSKECRILKRLNQGVHQHLIRLIYANQGLMDGVATEAQVIEWLDGSSLEKTLTRLAPDGSTLDEAKHVMRQVLQVAKYMNSCGVVHHNICPSNLMNKKEVAKLIECDLTLVDFSLAGLHAVTADRMAGDFPSGVYAPPENYNQTLRHICGGADGRFDVFSCGVLLVRLLLGEAPDWKYQKPTPNWKLLGKRLDFDGVDFLKRALAIDPRDRPHASDLLKHTWLRVTDATTAAPPGNDEVEVKIGIKREREPDEHQEPPASKKTKVDEAVRVVRPRLRRSLTL